MRYVTQIMEGTAKNGASYVLGFVGVGRQGMGVLVLVHACREAFVERERYWRSL